MEELEAKIYSLWEKIENLEEKDLRFSKEHSGNNPIKKNLSFLISSKKKYKELKDNESKYRELLEEKDLRKVEKEIIDKELKDLQSEKNDLLEKIKEKLLSIEDKNQNLIVEISPGVGGIEAGLFARDLYSMYYKFCERKKWKADTIETKADSLGNFSLVVFSIKGKDVFNLMKYEAGIHRVQRVPVTEKKGRLQTSTAGVVIFPEPTKSEIKIIEKDIKIETYRSSGAGGQHVNTTDSAVRVTHLPTGLIATSQDGRSQHDNKEKALITLRSRLFAKHQEERGKEIGNLRFSTIGTSGRNEKIRTYNYRENRFTDHRVNKDWYNLSSIMLGNLEEIYKFLQRSELEKIIVNFESEKKN